VNDLAPVVERIDNIDATIARMEAQWATPAAATPHPLAQYADLGEYARAVYRGEADADLIARTFADQITSQNDGVNPVGWVKDVKRIVFLGRRAITAFGADALVVSLGTDTHQHDPIGRFDLPTTTFTSIGRRIAALGLPTAVVQEGGYHLPSLGASVTGVLSAWA